jgi:hypothetical protein
MDRAKIAGLVYNNPVAVKFTKADGSQRVLLCTLSKQLVPSVEHSRVDQVDPNQDYLRVWDLEKQSWRSFKYDTVMDYKVLEKVQAA